MEIQIIMNLWMKVVVEIIKNSGDCIYDRYRLDIMDFDVLINHPPSLFYFILKTY